MQQLTVVKIGGNIVDDDKVLSQFLDDFAQLPFPKILVHGGGKVATKMAHDLAIPTSIVEGRRITSAAMLPIAVMVYAGLLNKQITTQLQTRNCDALGVSGADAKLITSYKRPVEALDYGFVGDFSPQDVNHTRLKQLLDLGLCPVFSAITADQGGQLLNTNADTIASNLAVALAPYYQVALVYCFEHRGVLRNIQEEDSVIPTINTANFNALKDEGIITAGMLPKITNALASVEQYVHQVCIKSAKDLLNPTAGTIISY